MSLPIRCFTCGKVTGHLFEKFWSYDDKEQAYKDLEIVRYCCKRTMMTTIDTFDMTSLYDSLPLPSSVVSKSETSDDRVYNCR